MQVSKDYYDEIFDFKGQWDVPSRCGLRIAEQGGSKIIIVTELYLDNPGTSVTAAGITLARQICKAKNLDISQARYVECNPDMNSKLEFYDEEYFEVTFDRQAPTYRKLPTDEIKELFRQ